MGKFYPKPDNKSKKRPRNVSGNSSASNDITKKLIKRNRVNVDELKKLKKIADLKFPKRKNEKAEDKIEISDSEPVDKEKLVKYQRGEEVNKKNVLGQIEKVRIKNKEEKINYSVKQSIKTEILLTEDQGFLEVDEDEVSTQFRQSDIQKAVDPLSSNKRFDLVLKDFGPYRMNYTKNGRFLLLGGRKGHVATIDWVSKKLLCEINVMESIYDLCWLHQESFFAVAQKKWVYIYDNQGVEIHCLKKLYDVFKMVFLPYHFLLVTVSNNGYLSWLDTSIGEIVEHFHISSHGVPAAIAQNPYNAMLCIGHSTGTVSFWSPNNKKPAVTKWCHKQPISAVAFDPKGINFATASVDRTLKIWDARNLNGPLHEYTLLNSPNCISISHRKMMALGTGNIVEIYKEESGLSDETKRRPYLRHKVSKTISNIEFCPFEDVLGIAHSSGFGSILVPGSGEANFDALEINPFQSKSQRKESEVQALLGKIPAELITWDPTELRKMHIPSLEEITRIKSQLPYVKKPDIHIEPRRKFGRRQGSLNPTQRKKIIKEEQKRNFINAVKEMEKEENKTEESQSDNEVKSVLDRFKRKSNKK